ncbi:MAG: TonB-dependent receptor [Flavobacteriales bacterium]|nr:TonB-dependent receptor [Flavobacteriales bacterium]
MNKFLILGLLALISHSQLFAQRKQGNRQRPTEKSTLSGTVVNKEGIPIPFANIAVYRQRDSILISGTASDEEGVFSIKLRPSRYFITFSFLSYQTKTHDNIALTGSSLDLGNISLSSKVELLEEVEILAERSQMELKFDKRVFNIDKDLANAGSNAAEILDNIPSVQVDVEGNISLRGSENVRVLIDGKPSTITGTSTADVLRQFQGSMIEKIEVITNPSARYDAEGEVGIINIVLKKNKRSGLNGGIETVLGHPDNYRLSFNLNYRTKKYNLFTSYGVSYRNSPGSSSNYQEFNGQDTSFIFESESERRRKSIGQNIRLGSDIFLNNYNTITVSGLYSFSDQENISNLEYRDLNSSKELFQKVVRKDKEDESGENIQASFNYTKTFKQEDRKFTTDLQWSESNDLEESDIQQNNGRTLDKLLQQSSNIEANRTILIQSDYVHPLKNDRQIEGGFRSTLRTLENVYSVKESENGSPFAILSLFNNDFEYDENIYAAYVQFANEINKFSYQLGLRGEYSDISSSLRLTNEVFKQEYFNLFPSLFLTYKFDKTKQLQLSYSRRINRPRFRYLLPFQTFSDNRNLWRGNPNLKPEYTDSYEIGFLRYFEKGSFFTSLYYRHRNQVIDRIVTANENGATVRFPVNLAVENNVGLELNSSYKFSKKISLNANFNFYRAIREGEYEGQKLDFDVFTWNSRTSLKIKVLPKVDFQTSFRYRAAQESTQGKTKALYNLDLSAGKDVLKGKGTVVASVRDVFNTRKRRSIVDTDQIYSESEFQWRARQFLLTFSYRINQKKKRGGNRGKEEGSGDNF